MKWIDEIVDILENIDPKTQAIKNSIHVFKKGQGFLTNGLIVRIFFWSDLPDDNNASE